MINPAALRLLIQQINKLLFINVSTARRFNGRYQPIRIQNSIQSSTKIRWIDASLSEKFITRMDSIWFITYWSGYVNHGHLNTIVEEPYKSVTLLMQLVLNRYGSDKSTAPWPYRGLSRYSMINENHHSIVKIRTQIEQNQKV